jgi:ankyrin repeat protein
MHMHTRTHTYTHTLTASHAKCVEVLEQATQIREEAKRAEEEVAKKNPKLALGLESQKQSVLTQRQNCEQMLTAASGGDLAKIEGLLALSTSEATLETERNDGKTPLLLAAQEGHVAAVAALLGAGAAIEKRGRYGWSALCLACQGGHTECVRLLLDAGASQAPNSPGSNANTALSVSAECGYLDCVALLLPGASLQVPGNKDSTAAIEAAGKGHLEILMLLVEHKADVQQVLPDSAGLTALMLAAHFGRSECIEYLLSQGVARETVNEEGKTALDIAKSNKKKDCVALLEQTD